MAYGCLGLGADGWVRVNPPPWVLQYNFSVRIVLSLYVELIR